MAQRLKSITLRGFKTIKDLEGFQPGPLTVLIGPNGAGKSNFISFFRLLSWALVPPGQLQEHVAKLGGASAILHDGPERTRDIEAHLILATDAGENDYSFRLAYAAGDTLIYTEEKFRFSKFGWPPYPQWTVLGAGHREPELIKSAEGGNSIGSTITTLLQRVIVHQFHDTSEGSRIRQKWSVDEGRWLKEDAGNLAPFLYRLRQQYRTYYARIVETIRLILPFFADFELRPEFGKVLLAWRERGTDRVFTASQAADGMLRILALVALLQQPESDLPDVVILDEPELGLHPYAIEVLAGLIRAASHHAQVILATQSVSLIDRFTPEDVVVVNRDGRESKFQRYTEADLHSWLQEYNAFGIVGEECHRGETLSLMRLHFVVEGQTEETFRPRPAHFGISLPRNLLRCPAHKDRKEEREGLSWRAGFIPAVAERPWALDEAGIGSTCMVYDDGGFLPAAGRLSRHR